MICKICGFVPSCKNKHRGLATHLRWKHDISSKDYYKKYISNESLCTVCKTKDALFRNLKDGFSDYCSSNCANIGNVEKIKQTMFKKYGATHHMKTKEGKEKHKKAIKEKYGVEHQLQIKEVKDKIRKTCKEKYGVEHPLKSKEVKQKRRLTCKEKYGVEYSLQSKEIKEKGFETKKKLYGDKFFNNRKKALNTCKDKYGNDTFAGSNLHRKIMEEKGKWFPKNQNDNYTFYKLEVWKLTERTYKKYKHIIDPNSQRSTEFHLDHKYSISKGFKNNICPWVISHICNLEIISSTLNESKQGDCSISLEELFKLIKEQK